MTSPGFQVDPDMIEDAAESLDGLAAEIASGRDKLRDDGELPTLDPLSKAMGAVSLAIDGPIGMISAPLAYLAGMAISEEIDPYPPIRNAWLDAMKRYRKLLGDDAERARDTASQYRRDDDFSQDRVEDSYSDPVPIPTIPGEPTAPMPTHPGEPTVPMPDARPGAGSGSVDI